MYTLLLCGVPFYIQYLTYSNANVEGFIKTRKKIMKKDIGKAGRVVSQLKLSNTRKVNFFTTGAHKVVAHTKTKKQPKYLPPIASRKRRITARSDSPQYSGIKRRKIKPPPGWGLDLDDSEPPNTPPRPPPGWGLDLDDPEPPIAPPRPPPGWGLDLDDSKPSNDPPRKGQISVALPNSKPSPGQGRKSASPPLSRPPPGWGLDLDDS